jgi:hypothetical protein
VHPASWHSAGLPTQARNQNSYAYACALLLLRADTRRLGICSFRCTALLATHGEARHVSGHVQSVFGNECASASCAWKREHTSLHTSLAARKCPCPSPSPQTHVLFVVLARSTTACDRAHMQSLSLAINVTLITLPHPRVLRVGLTSSHWLNSPFHDAIVKQATHIAYPPTTSLCSHSRPPVGRCAQIQAPLRPSSRVEGCCRDGEPYTHMSLARAR